MLNKQLIEFLINEGENHYIEFKEKILCDACLFEDLLALCNNETEESYLLIGIQDKTKNIVGIQKDQIQSIRDKILFNIKRLPRTEFFETLIESKTILCIRIYDKLEAPYFFEKDDVIHGKCRKKDKILGKINFVSRKSDGNVSDFNTLERLFKKRLGVNLSPLEKIEQIFNRPNFYDEFERPSSFVEKDFMNEIPLDGFNNKERNFYFQGHEVVLLKSDYNFRIRFFTNAIYHFSHTEEELEFVRSRIEKAQKGDDKYFNYLLQPRFTDNFNNYRTYNSFWLNKALELKEKIQDFSCVNPSYFFVGDNYEEYFKAEYERRTSVLSYKSDSELYRQIQRIFNYARAFQYKDLGFGHDFGLKKFLEYKNIDLNQDSSERYMYSNNIIQIYYCLDYNDRFLVPNIRNNMITTSSKYFLEISFNHAKFLLPSLENIMGDCQYSLADELPLNFFELSYFIKSDNNYRIYQLYCQKYKVKSHMDNFLTDAYNISDICMFLYVSGILIFDNIAQKDKFLVKLNSRKDINDIVNNQKWEKKTSFNNLTQEKRNEIVNKLHFKEVKHKNKVINKKFEEQFGKDRFEAMRSLIQFALKGN